MIYSYTDRLIVLSNYLKYGDQRPEQRVEVLALAPVHGPAGERVDFVVAKLAAEQIHAQNARKWLWW